MARHAAIESPPTGLFPVIEPAGRSHGRAPDLGTPAVSAAMHADLALDNADYFGATGAPHLAVAMRAESERGYAEVRKTLQEVRTQIQQAPDSEVAEDYLRPFLQDVFVTARERGARHPTMLRWLSDERYGATDGQLYDFISDHLNRLADHRRDPEVQMTVEWAKADYIDKVERAVGEGRYDSYALKTLDKVRKAGVVIGDVWDTHIIGRKGYRLWGKDFVVVGQQVYGNEEAHDEVHETVLHELDHLQFPNATGEPAWQREAMAEHNTQSMTQGQWETFNPGDRANDEGVYWNERRLEHIILTCGRKPIPTELAIRAHTSARNSMARKQYAQAVADSWTPDTLNWIEDRINRHMAVSQEGGQAQSEATRMVGNELWQEAQRVGTIGRHARMP